MKVERFENKVGKLHSIHKSYRVCKDEVLILVDVAGYQTPFSLTVICGDSIYSFAKLEKTIVLVDLHGSKLYDNSDWDNLKKQTAELCNSFYTIQFNTETREYHVIKED